MSSDSRIRYCGIEQLDSSQVHTPEVVGSSPSPAIPCQIKLSRESAFLTSRMSQVRALHLTFWLRGLTVSDIALSRR